MVNDKKVKIIDFFETPNTGHIVWTYKLWMMLLIGFKFDAPNDF